MALAVPPEIPSSSSAGEKLVFSLLQRLPDECIVYYEPRINGRHPDFVVLIPTLGVLTIEVKGWYLANIQQADRNTVLVEDRGGLSSRPHPLSQARAYMFGLMDFCKKSPLLTDLLVSDGQYQGRFIMPFGHLAVLSNISTSQMYEDGRASLWKEIFSPKEVITREQIPTLMKLSSDALLDRLKLFFNPYWPITPLVKGQMNALRAAIHPEIVVESLFGTTDGNWGRSTDLKVLDLRQESNARLTGTGHRVVYGVAGSGKTVLLLARARLLAQAKPTTQILILCYNVALAAYLEGCMADLAEKVTVFHFDGWATKLGISRQYKENDELFGKRLWQALQGRNGSLIKYDAILVDEAQDFAADWFQCVVHSLLDPTESDLLIVGDGHQGLYKRRPWTWSDVGIKARGRTMSSKLDLTRNYRNTREILEIAANFSTQSGLVKDDLPQGSLQVDASKAVRTTGIYPQLLQCNDKRHECRKAEQLIRGLVRGKWLDQDIPPVPAQRIGVLYPLLKEQDRPILHELIESLSDIGALWLSEPKNSKARRGFLQPGVKIQTIHSSKGLQYAAVILLFADELPREGAKKDEETDCRLMYVGLTRAEDYLAITCSKTSQFVQRIAPNSA